MFQLTGKMMILVLEWKQAPEKILHQVAVCGRQQKFKTTQRCS
jgi:hypothetical protein